MITSQEFINELVNNTFVKLKPSSLGGVGVFAIRRIPKGCRTMFSHPDNQWINISKVEVAMLPDYAQEMIYNYCLYDHENYFVPAQGFKKMDLSHYLNHADQPNITSISDGDFFEAVRDIEVGEELLVDYATIADYDDVDER